MYYYSNTLCHLKKKYTKYKLKDKEIKINRNRNSNSFFPKG